MSSIILPSHEELETFYYSEISPCERENMDTEDVNEILTALTPFIEKYVRLNINQSVPCELTDQNNEQETP